MNLVHVHADHVISQPEYKRPSTTAMGSMQVRADAGGEKTSAPCVFHCPVYLSGRRRKSGGGDEYVFPMRGRKQKSGR